MNGEKFDFSPVPLIEESTSAFGAYDKDRDSVLCEGAQRPSEKVSGLTVETVYSTAL